MRWGLVFALLSGLLAAGQPPAVAAAACNDSSWIGGTVDICDGELVYRDYVYDDYGADTGALFASNTGGLSQPDGDVRYETDVNSADLLNLRLRPEGERLHVTFELNSLFSPGSTAAYLAVDEDNDASTGGGRWSDLDIGSAGWETVHRFASGDPDTNTIEGEIPLPSGVVRVQAATAVAGGQVMNVAFRGTHESGSWWEDRQADVLSTKVISEFGAVVDMADLAGGVTRVEDPGPGLHQRVYTSEYTIGAGEGVDYAGVPGKGAGGQFGQEFHFLGRHQPYGIYIPDKSAPHGVQFALHGYSANHASLVGQAGFQQRFGEELNRIVLVPLGRGPAGFYSSWSERDVLDVLADVQANYDVDDDKLFMGGYSMGGYGTLRFATLYPDLWAGYVNWVGFNGDCFRPLIDGCEIGAVGKPIDFLGNLRHVPGASLYSGLDELVWINQWLAMMLALAETDNAYALYLHPVAEHLTYAVVDDWRKEAAYTKDLTRVDDPARVTFRYDPSLDMPELGIAHDEAYWASSIEARDAGVAGVDLTSEGCGLPVTQHSVGTGIGIDPVPWVSQEGSSTTLGTRPASAVLYGTLAGVASLTVDVDGACLDGPFDYRIDTDGPATITTSDGRTIKLTGAGTFEGTA